MELRTFITEALSNIIGGVHDAQLLHHGSIVPSTNTTVDFVPTGLTPFQKVDFEVLVVIETIEGSEGKIGVVAGFISGGRGSQNSAQASHTTTLRFSVPICFPAKTGPNEPKSAPK